MFKKKTFTLIELLVVVAVIGVLVSILLSALQKARQQAYSTECKNHLKQIAVAVYFHSDDGRFRSIDKLDRELEWSNRGAQHSFEGGKKYSIWTCPTARSDGDGLTKDDGSDLITDEQPLSYVFNTAYVPWNASTHPFSQMDAAYPSETILAGDGRLTRWYGAEMILRPSANSDSNVLGGYESWRNNPNSFTDKETEVYAPELDIDGYFARPDIRDPWYGHFRYRHGGNVNMNANFADGHVETVRPYGLTIGNFTIIW
ncbi:MAG: prepilin-type N-terminal cleavage/methylation domain-containing protein [Lentisphaeria bacterium]|nr:prepilin-type N-terminal cleavage/methylation domain-containing protein [Lentisphaeria bacterium]